MRKVAVSLADSVDLRIILSVLYIMTEVIRNEKAAGSNDFKEIAETFTNELSKLNTINTEKNSTGWHSIQIFGFQTHQLEMNYLQ